MMKHLLSFGCIALLTFPNTQAFLQVSLSKTGRSTSFAIEVTKGGSNVQQKDVSSGESEAERLLRLARKLRQQAEEAEEQVHEHLYQKKREEDVQMDHWIQNLSLSQPGEQNKKHTHVVKALKERKPCMETLERIVDRLHEHHMIASGQECVEAQEPKAVHRVHHKKDEAKVKSIENQAETLFEAIDIVDSDTSSGKPKAESRHWGGEGRAKQLRNRWSGLLRGHAEQFLKRQQSFIDAQTIKKDNPPPPKVKDDHRLLP